ncbi:hypothetical protein VKT23_012080 [Stygiomarasmius scandens]|uniref:Repressor/activator protein 1 homolog n=1 Tax=Marasmiellus scandens TaxID=2682957 RepID=A0ABR1J7L2_9AGAR
MNLEHPPDPSTNAPTSRTVTFWTKDGPVTIPVEIFAPEEDELLVRYIAKNDESGKKRSREALFQSFVQQARHSISWLSAIMTSFLASNGTLIEVFLGRIPKPTAEYGCTGKLDLRPKIAKLKAKPRDDGQGARSRRRRTLFTKEEDTNLVKYLAMAQQATSSKALFTDLVKSEKWAANRDWRAWKEHYARKSDWFDERIRDFQTQNGVQSSESVHENKLEVSGAPDRLLGIAVGPEESVTAEETEPVHRITDDGNVDYADVMEILKDLVENDVNTGSSSVPDNLGHDIDSEVLTFDTAAEDNLLSLLGLSSSFPDDLDPFELRYPSIRDDLPGSLTIDSRDENPQTSAATVQEEQCADKEERPSCQEPVEVLYNIDDSEVTSIVCWSSNASLKALISLG